MRNLLKICSTWGVDVRYTNQESASAPKQGLIFINRNLSKEAETIILAHEMGHVLTYMEGGSEKDFPHLRLFEKNGKHRLKSNKYRRSLLGEEQRAWQNAENLLKDLSPDYNIKLFFEIKEESLETYKV